MALKDGPRDLLLDTPFEVPGQVGSHNLLEWLVIAIEEAGGSSGATAASGANPDIDGRRALILTQADPTVLEAILNSPEATELRILFGDANTTVPHGAVFKLRGQVDVNPQINRVMPLIRFGSVFYEVG